MFPLKILILLTSYMILIATASPIYRKSIQTSKNKLILYKSERVVRPHELVKFDMNSRYDPNTHIIAIYISAKIAENRLMIMLKFLIFILILMILLLEIKEQFNTESVLLIV